MVNIYKFCKKEILIQPPGEPREHHLGDVRQKKFERFEGRYILYIGALLKPTQRVFCGPTSSVIEVSKYLNWKH